MNDLLGHNQPDLTQTAREIAKELSGWMGEVPVIETEEKAREGKLWADRAHLCLGDLEDERKAKVAPLKQQAKEIDERYKAPKEVLSNVLGQLKERLTSFLEIEGRRRLEAARVAALAAQEAERVLVEARRANEAAQQEAAAGVLGGDAEANVVAEQVALRDAQKTARIAALAERDTHVRIGGGFRPPMSGRTYTVIHIDDPIKVLNVLGLTAKIETAMRQEINDYKRKHNKYPDGVFITKEKHL